LRAELLASSAFKISNRAKPSSGLERSDNPFGQAISSEPDLRGELLVSGAENNLTSPKHIGGLERSDKK
jgi:hypothetical protein